MYKVFMQGVIPAWMAKAGTGLLRGRQGMEKAVPGMAGILPGSDRPPGSFSWSVCLAWPFWQWFCCFPGYLAAEHEGWGKGQF